MMFADNDSVGGVQSGQDELYVPSPVHRSAAPPALPVQRLPR